MTGRQHAYQRYFLLQPFTAVDSHEAAGRPAGPTSRTSGASPGSDGGGTGRPVTRSGRDALKGTSYETNDRQEAIHVCFRVPGNRFP